MTPYPPFYLAHFFYTPTHCTDTTQAGTIRAFQDEISVLTRHNGNIRDGIEGLRAENRMLRQENESLALCLKEAAARSDDLQLSELDGETVVDEASEVGDGELFGFTEVSWDSDLDLEVIEGVEVEGDISW